MFKIKNRSVAKSIGSDDRGGAQRWSHSIAILGIVFALFSIYIGVASAITTYPPGALLQPGDVTSSHIRDNTIVGADISNSTSVRLAGLWIATSTPSAPMTLWSTTSNGAPLLVAANGASSTLFTILDNTRVGIGTTTPWSTLSVTGDLAVTATTSFNGVSYKFPSTDGASGNALKTNGAGQLSWGSAPAFAYTAGSTTIASATTDEITQATTPTKMKEIQISAGGSGTVDVQFSIYVQAGYTTYGRIYVNGVAVGTQRSTTSTTAVAFNEYITVSANDLVQLYVWGNDAGFRDYHSLNMYIKTAQYETTTTLNS